MPARSSTSAEHAPPSRRCRATKQFFLDLREMDIIRYRTKDKVPHASTVPDQRVRHLSYQDETGRHGRRRIVSHTGRKIPGTSADAGSDQRHLLQEVAAAVPFDFTSA